MNGGKMSFMQLRVSADQKKSSRKPAYTTTSFNPRKDLSRSTNAKAAIDTLSNSMPVSEIGIIYKEKQ